MEEEASSLLFCAYSLVPEYPSTSVLLTTGGLDMPETKGVRHAENY